MGPKARALQQEQPLQWEALAPHVESSLRSPQLEKSPRRNENPAQPTTDFKIYVCIHFSLKFNKSIESSGQE